MPEANEIAIARIQEQIKNLERKQDEYHALVMSEMKELKENLLNRVAVLENDSLKKIDFTNYDSTRVAPLIENVNTLMAYRWIIAGVLLASSVIAPVVWQFMTYYLSKR